jgi:hypothetical protein
MTTTTTTTAQKSILSSNSFVKILFRSDMGRTKQAFARNFLELQKLDIEVGCEYLPKSKASNTNNVKNSEKEICFWEKDNHMVFKNLSKSIETKLILTDISATIETESGCKYQYFYSSTTLVFEGRFEQLFQDRLIPEIFLLTLKHVHPKTKLWYYNAKGYFVQTIWEEHIYRLVNNPSFNLEPTTFTIPEYDEIKAYSVLNGISEDEAEEIIFKRDRFNGSKLTYKRIH